MVRRWSAYIHPRLVWGQVCGSYNRPLTTMYDPLQTHSVCHYLCLLGPAECAVGEHALGVNS